MRYILLIISLHYSVSLFAQTQEEVINARANISVSENILPSAIETNEDETSIELLIEDVDDLTATYAVSEDITFYATAVDLLDLGMIVDRYDEDQLLDNTPKPVDEIYPTERPSRFISAGLCFRF